VRNLVFLTPIPAGNTLKRYSIAAIAAVISVLLRWLLDPLLGHVAFYVTIYVAVTYCAVACGFAPAIFSGLIAFVGVFYWFVDPRGSFYPFRATEIHGMVGFFLVSTVLIVLGEANRTKQLRLNDTVVALTREAHERQRAEAALREAHDELEQRVIDRTAELSRTLDQLEAEITVREQTEARLRRLSLHLMTLQDEERRRIARDLHDTTGQTLAAMKMSIALIRQLQSTSTRLQPLVDDLDALADEALQEVRTTSYLLHPPLLDEAGIASAARWFVEGFARRSGILVQCDIAERMDRPPRPCELVLFRVLQECLTNVHRHSGATEAAVHLVRNSDQFELEVADNGKGIPEEHLRRVDSSSNNSGVGITGMRERVRELGGQLKITALHPGTSVRVTLPTQSLAEPESGTPAFSLSVPNGATVEKGDFAQKKTAR
jgi:signal transduction histidine kinase